MVMAHVLVQVLRQRDPELVIDMLAPAWSLPLAHSMPEVRHTLPLPFSHGELALRRRYHLACSLRTAGYQRIIVLQNSFKSALIPFWSRIPHRVGYIGEWRWPLLTDARPLDKTTLPRTIDRFAALGIESGVPLPDPLPYPRLQIDPRQAGMARARWHIPSDRPLVVCCPGAEYGPAKQWPAGHFAALGRQFLQHGWSVCLLGGPNDTGHGARILSNLSDLTAHDAPVHDLTGRTSLQDAIDMLAHADLVISNDSGLMHIAAALHRPLIALFGSSSPAMTPPLSPLARILSVHLPCSPCWQRTCSPGHYRCLTDITPQLVFRAAAELAGHCLAGP
jgi:heptosyltransferase-2